MAKKHDTREVNKHPEWARKTKENSSLKKDDAEKKIIIHNPVVKTNLLLYSKYRKMDKPATKEFDWTPYENGWNGKSLRGNNLITLTNKGDKVFCHESYAQDIYNKYSGVQVTGSKELVKNALVSISNISVINNDAIMLTINGGSNNVIVDLNKEQKFLNQFSIGDEKMTKEVFVNSITTHPEFKAELLGMNLLAKITPGDLEKASIWDGYVETLTREMKEQITLNNKAYFATILSTNKGGFVVDIMNTIRAFMPGSMAAANRITDFESLVGTKFEVMVESWDPNYGFVVSRKKYLKTMLPGKINELHNKLAVNKDTLFTGHVTGTTPFGVFVELDEFITGMLHKTLVRDETRDAMRNNTIVPGTEVQVYIHKIEGTRVILSDVPTAERDIVIARREAEEIMEKAEYENEKQLVNG